MPKTLDNIKDDILSVTRKLLSDEGYGKLNVRTIASKCGIATGTLYNYYASKQEIVDEILEIEWNMMLRRIEQGSKMDISLIDKLGIFYAELRTLMNDVHNVWFDNSFLNFDGNEVARMKSKKEVLLRSLSDRVYNLINDKNENMDYEFLSDVICRLFILYVYKGDVEFSKLKPIIESLLYNLRQTTANEELDAAKQIKEIEVGLS